MDNVVAAILVSEARSYRSLASTSCSLLYVWCPKDLWYHYDQFKNIEVDGQAQAELLGRMFLKEDIITSTQLNIIKREIKSPTHDYGAADSMWELYNHVTFAMKQAHPSTWMQDHINVHDFFNKYDKPSASPIIIDAEVSDNQLLMF